MPKPYSIDLRKRVVKAVENGMHMNDAAKAFQVCAKTIFNWQKRLQTKNSLDPESGYQKGHSHKVTDLDAFRQFANENRYQSVPEMTVIWERQKNQKISESAIKKWLRRINFTSKKKLLALQKQIQKKELNI